MDFSTLCRHRYSLRSFSAQPVEQRLLQTVLEAGRSAPTAHNCQPQRIYVLSSEEALRKIDQATPCRYGAPVALLICGDTSAAWVNDWNGRSAAEMDATIAATHMMLQAADLGLGSVFVARMDTEKVKTLFQLPDAVEPFCLLPLGHPAEDAAPSPNHDNRKPLEEIVKEL